MFHAAFEDAILCDGGTLSNPAYKDTNLSHISSMPPPTCFFGLAYCAHFDLVLSVH